MGPLKSAPSVSLTRGMTDDEQPNRVFQFRQLHNQSDATSTLNDRRDAKRLTISERADSIASGLGTVLISIVRKQWVHETKRNCQPTLPSSLRKIGNILHPLDRS